MKLTGQKLREKRESARLTISEVSLATKINPKVLMAMEVGDSEHLPAKTFLRGFVRAYAGFLKMNVAEVLELFNQELGEAQAAAAPKEETEAPVDEPEKVKPVAKKVDVDGEGNNAFRMFIIGGILFLIIAIIGVRSIVQKYERERNTDAAPDLSASKVIPLQEKKSDAVNPAPASEKPENPAAPTGGADPALTSTPAPAQPPIEVKPEPTKAETKIAPPTPPPEPPKAAPVPPPPKPEVVKTEPPKPEPPKEAVKEAEPPKEKPAPKGKQHEIILEALDKVEVSYKLRGESKKIPMTPGQVHMIVTDEPVSFDVSDGGALNITDNGRDKGPAGDLGHRKQINIP